MLSVIAFCIGYFIIGYLLGIVANCYIDGKHDLEVLILLILLWPIVILGVVILLFIINKLLNPLTEYLMDKCNKNKTKIREFIKKKYKGNL